MDRRSDSELHFTEADIARARNADAPAAVVRAILTHIQDEGCRTCGRSYESAGAPDELVHVRERLTRRLGPIDGTPQHQELGRLFVVSGAEALAFANGRAISSSWGHGHPDSHRLHATLRMSTAGTARVLFCTLTDRGGAPLRARSLKLVATGFTSTVATTDEHGVARFRLVGDGGRLVDGSRSGETVEVFLLEAAPTALGIESSAHDRSTENPSPHVVPLEPGTTHITPSANFQTWADNQFVPNQLSNQVFASERGLAEISAARDAIVRREYLRALVNTKQLVLNRAFVYNNPSLSQDFVARGASRGAFQTLLRDGSIIPFLHTEDDPREEPDVDHDRVAFAAWTELVDETPLRALRLSWDPDTNVQRADEVAARFHHWVTSLRTRPFAEFYARGRGYHGSEAEAFIDRLRQVATFAFGYTNTKAKDMVSRTAIYKEFVLVDGSDPVLGIYDRRKPFARDIKDLVDLRYNTNLPDVVGMPTLTPVGGLTASALANRGREGALDTLSASQIATLLRDVAFERVQQGLMSDSLSALTLEDVVAIRQAPEWTAYIAALEDLLRRPLTFASDEGAPLVYRRYGELCAVMERFAMRRMGHEADRVRSMSAMTWSAGTASLVVAWSKRGTYWWMSEPPAGMEQRLPISGRLLIVPGEARAREGDAGWTGMSTELVQRHLEGPVDEWHELRRLLLAERRWEPLTADPRVRGTTVLNLPA